MTIPKPYGLHSLRFKLVLASIVVEAIMLTALVWNSMRITEDALHEAFQMRTRTIEPLMNASLVGPLLQRDYATLEERVRAIINESVLVYVEVSDELGQLAARGGEVPKPANLNSSLQDTDQIYDQEFDLTIAGQAIGHARYGLNVSLLQTTLGNLRTQGIGLALIGIVLTFLLLSSLGYLLTRHLKALAQAAQAIQGGDYTTRVKTVGRDEVAVAAQSFNAMASTIERDIAQRKLVTDLLHESEERLHQALNAAHMRTFDWDISNDIINWSSWHEDLWGVKLDQFGDTYKTFSQRIHPDDLVGVNAELSRCIAAHDAFVHEFRLVWLDNSTHWISCRGEFTFAFGGEPLRFTGVILETTKSKLAEESVRENEAHFRAIFESAADGIFITGNDGYYIHVNTQGCRMLGYTHDELLKMTYDHVIIDEQKPQFAPTLAAVSDGAVAQSEWQLRRKDGVAFPVEVNIAALPTGGYIGTVRDITERKRAELEVGRLAFTDALTNLPNRTAFLHRLKLAIQQAQAKGATLAIILMDLNNFREVNDTLGHQNGDKVLVQLADRLQAALWEKDIVARLGGDEFAVLLPQLASKAHIELVVDKILLALRPALLIEGVPLDVQAAMGIALYPDHGTNADTLMQHADVALYSAKEKHLTHALYNSDTDDYNPLQLALMSELRQALQHEELTLHYQPVIDLKTGKCVAVEALVRWQHPSRGLLFPDTFIPAAEKTMLIGPLTTWVLANALRQKHRWERAGIDLHLCVNLSVRNLQQEDLVEEIRDILLSSGVLPEQLTLEITESAIMLDPQRAMLALTELHDVGIRFAIDDFGIGHSSLAYLKDLPVDKLKVDKSFVMDFNNPANAAIVQATIGLAHNLGLIVTAEGVENQAALDALKLLGCDHAQGYHLSRPLSVDKLDKWLRESPWGYASNSGEKASSENTRADA